MQKIIQAFMMGAVLFGVETEICFSQIDAGRTASTEAILPEIVVTATRSEEESVQLPQSVSVVTQEEIQDRHPTKPVEAVRDEPGVWIQKTGAGGGTPVIRGMMGNTVLYLVDGIRINNGRLFSGPNAFFNQVDVGSIDRIEILKGPGSVQYGSDAMGGVIHLQTPTLTIFPETPEWGGRVLGQYSTADQGWFGHSEAYYADSRMNAIAGATVFTADDFRAGGGDTLDHTSLNSYGGFGKARIRLSEGHVLTLGCLENVRTDVERYDQSQRNPNSGDPRYFTPREERTLVYLKDSIESEGGMLSHLESYLYYQNYNSESDYNTEKNERIFQRDVTCQDQDMYGTGISATSPLGDGLKLVYGTDFRYEEFTEDKDRCTWSFADPDGTWSSPKGTTPDGSYDVADAFVLLDWNPVERLRLTAGTRFESTHLHSDPVAQNATAGFTVDDLRLDERWNSTTFSLGGIYWLTETLALNSQGSTGYRAPTYSDVLSFGPFTYGVNIPSPEVGPEKCTTWEFGPRYESERLSASLTYFYTWLDDMVDSARVEGFTDINGNGVEDTGEGNYAKENFGTGHIQGVESAAEWRFIEDWALFGTFAWADGWDDEQADYLRFIPPLNGTAGVRWHATEKLRLSAFARMVSAQDQVSEDDKSDPARATDPAITFPAKNNPPLRSDYSIPGYVTLHARADFAATKRIRIFLAGDNLTDKRYREAFSRLDAPGINVTMGAEWNF